MKTHCSSLQLLSMALLLLLAPLAQAQSGDILIESSIRYQGVEAENQGSVAYNEHGACGTSGVGHLASWMGDGVCAYYYLSGRPTSFDPTPTASARGTSLSLLPAFEAALTDQGFQIEDFSFTFTEMSLGNDAEGTDWVLITPTETSPAEHPGDYEELRHYRGGTLTLQIDGTPFLTTETPTLHITYTQTNGVQRIEGDSDCVDAAALEIPAGTPASAQAIAQAFLTDMNNGCFKFDYDSQEIHVQETDSDAKYNWAIFDSEGRIVVVPGSPTVGGPFTAATAFDGVALSDAEWGDYDNDGDLDLLIAGHTRGTDVGEAWLYDNNGDGTFSDAGLAFPDLFHASLAWGDYDNDGWLDFVLAGETLINLTRVTQLYRNVDDGAGGRTFELDTRSAFTGLGRGDVAWADLDHDGDLDLVASGLRSAVFGGFRTLLYLNEGRGVFNEAPTQPFTNVHGGSLAIADYDLDGDHDVLLHGNRSGLPSRITMLYQNDGAGTFTEDANTSFPGFANNGAARWGDYDGDGDPDLLLTGGTEEGRRTTLYHNNRVENGTATFSALDLGFEGLWDADAAWGDYDNDGNLDLVLNGENGSDEAQTLLYRNEGGTFTTVDAMIEGTTYGALAWGDYDDDGDLDLIVAGDDNLGGVRAQLYRNDTLLPNTLPHTPSSLTGTVAGNTVTFTWTPGTDAETDATGLSYNLDVQTSLTVGPNTTNLAPFQPGHSDRDSGYRQIVQTGNAGQNLSWQFTVDQPTEGTRHYCAQVQTIDAAYAGSSFSPMTCVDLEAAPQQHATLEANPDSLHIPPGGTFTMGIDLHADGQEIANVDAVTFRFAYPVDQVEFVDSALGAFAESGNAVHFFQHEPADGFIAFGYAIKADEAPLTGLGLMASLTFHVKDGVTGTTVPFTFLDATVTDNAGNPFAVTALPGTAEISEAAVWPGDASNDGVVDEADVLPLSLYFDLTGPARTDKGLGWEVKPADLWEPEAATYADANGDGKIDEKDILPIGRSFGKTTGGSPTSAPHHTTAFSEDYVLPVLGAGESVTLELVVGEAAPLTDVLAFATRIAMPANRFRVTLNPDAAFEAGGLLEFINRSETHLALSLGRRGADQAFGPYTGSLVAITLTAQEALDQPTPITLERFLLLTGDGTTQPIAAQIKGVNTTNETAVGVSAHYELHGAYPNPFNPETTIGYALPQASTVRIEVFNLLGQRVQTLVHAEQAAGRHTVRWDGRSSSGATVASGTYLIRMSSDQFVQTRKVMLLK